MKEHYVTYDQAVKLKELGFDWPTSHYYCAFDNETDIRLWNVHPKQSQNAFRSPQDKVIADAPRLDQAQTWLRDCKDLHILPRLENVNKPDYVCIITLMRKESIRITDDGKYFPTYELALSAGIDAAIELLTDKLNDNGF